MWPPTAPAPNPQIFMPIEYRAMKICRFDDNRLGVVRDDMVYDVTPALKKLPTTGYPLPRHDPLIANLAKLKKHLVARGKGKPLSKVRLLSPVANPGKI